VPIAQPRPTRPGVTDTSVPEIFPGFQSEFGQASFTISEATEGLEGLLDTQRGLNVELRELEEIIAGGIFTSPGIPIGSVIHKRRQDSIREELSTLQVTIEIQEARFASAQWKYDTLASYIPLALRAQAIELLTEEELLGLAPYTTRTNEDKEFAKRIASTVSQNRNRLAGISSDERSLGVIENLQRRPGNFAPLLTLDTRQMSNETILATIRELSQFSHPDGVEASEVRDMITNFFPEQTSAELLDERKQARESAERIKQADMRVEILRQETRELASGVIDSKLRQALWAQAASKPALIAMRPLEFYAKYVGKPFVGSVLGINAKAASILGVANDEQKEFLDLYENARDNDLNRWLATGNAFGNWEINGVKKFMFEVVLDPLNLLGVGWFTKVLKPIPIIGKHLAWANQGYARVWEVGFDMAKSGLVRAIPKTIRNQSLAYQKVAYNTTRVYLERSVGKRLNRITSQEVLEVMVPAIDEAMLNPQSPDDMVQAGLQLLDNPAITPDNILEMTRIVPGTGHITANSITIDILSKVNDGIEHTKFLSDKSWLGKNELADFLMLNLNISQSDVARTAMIAWIDSIIATNRSKAINRLTGDNIISIMGKIMSGAGDDFTQAQKTLISNRRYQQGIYAALNRMEGMAHTVWFGTIDAYITRSFARAYLLFGMFGVMNVLEVAVKSGLAGVNPFYKSGVHHRAASEFFGLSGHVPLDVITPSSFNILQQLPEEDFVRLASQQDLSARQIRDARNSTGNWMEKIATGRYLGAFTGGFTFEDIFGYNLAKNINAGQKQSYFVNMYNKLLEEQEIDTLASIVRFSESLTDDIEGKIAPKYTRAFQEELARRLRTGNLDHVRQLADDFIPGDVYAAEAFDILKQVPDITPELRDLIIQKVRTGALWSRGPRAVTDLFNGEFREILITQHMESPVLFKTRVEELVSGIIDIQPATIDELNMKMTMVDNLSEMYGDVVHISLEAAQLQGSRITNPQFKDTMFNQWWTERIVPHLVDTEVQVQTLVDAMKANLATDDVIRGMQPNQQQIYLDLLDGQLDRMARIRTARLQQDTLRRSFFTSGGANYIPPGGLRSANNGKFWDDFNSEQRRIFNQVQPNIAETERGIFSLGTNLPGYQAPNIVDASQRVLVPRDIAALFGVDTNLLARNMYAPELMALRGRASFINRIMDKAEKGATAKGTTPEAMGYSRDKVSDIYDRITRDIQTSDFFLDSLQPGMIALESLREDLIRLGTRRGVLVSDEWKSWVDEVFKGITREEIVFDRLDKQLTGELLEMPLTEGMFDELMLSDTANILDLLAVQADGTAVALNREQGFSEGLRFIPEHIKEDLISDLRAITDGVVVDLPDTIANTGDFITDNASLTDLVEDWFENSRNDVLQLMGKTMEESTNYQRLVRIKLQERFPSGFITIHRGRSGRVLPLDREFTNITSDVNTASEFQRGFDRWQGITPEINDVIIRVEDVIGIGATNESELIIRGSVLRDRLENTITPVRLQERVPARIDEFLSNRGRATTIDVTNVNKTFTPEWQEVRQKALSETNKRYNQDFPDFDNQNAFNTFIRTIYPFWGYESHRWAWYLPREALRHPGAFALWGKYQDYTEQGYIHIPGTDLAANVLRGTIAMGGMRRLFMRDYPEFYDSFGGIAEVNDWLQRFGFYPGAGVGLLFSIFGAKTGQTQLGEITPTWVNSITNTLALAFPESEGVKFLQDTVFANRWRDYLISIEASKLGYNGVDMLLKQTSGEGLEGDEQRRWDQARRGVAKYALWSEQVTMTRMDPEERKKFHREVAIVLNELTGIPIEDLEDMRKNGLRVEDIAGGAISPEIHNQIATLSGWHRWSGAGMVLGPSELGEQYSITREFWREVFTYSEQQAEELLEIERELSITDNRGRPLRTIDQWMEARVNKSKRVNEFITTLQAKPRYKEVPMTLEDRVLYAEENKLLPVMENGLRELQEQWFAVELNTDWRNPDTGRLEPDWDTFFRQQQAIEAGISDVDVSLLPRFRAFIQRNSSPLTIEHSEANRELFRPYNVLRNIIQEQFSPEEQVLIERFSTTSDEIEQDRLQQEITTLQGHEGEKLISTYTRLLTLARTNMRSADPELDAWLVFFNKNMELQSPQALERWQSIRRQHGIASSTE